MKNKQINQYTISFTLAIAFLFMISSCKKQDDFLDAKRQKSDVVPNSINDLQAVLDNTYVMNQNYAEMGLIGADNNYVTDNNLDASPQYERNAYLWSKDIYQGQTDYDWLYAYQMVEYSNVVLDALKKLDPQNNSAAFNNIQGSALFYRAIAFYELSQLYCKPYNSGTATSDLGIPIRLSSDVNIKSNRSSVQECYDQMTADLKLAVNLLPVTPLYTTRPSSVAATALLAKIYLSMGNYTLAEDYANQTLQKFSTLLDFNSNLVDVNSDFRFPTFTTGNPEVIFYASCPSYYTIDSYPSDYGYVDPTLFSLYDNTDLRKTLFFNNAGGIVKFQGNYTGTYNNFGGIAINEIYLIRAECYARENNVTNALKDLNSLLVKRYVNGSFTPVSASDPDNALKLVLNERRKELPYTAQLRWEDLRRLNKDSRFAITITRNYKGSSYTLTPNDQKYVFPIPDLEIQLNNLPQNDR